MLQNYAEIVYVRRKIYDGNYGRITLIIKIKQKISAKSFYKYTSGVNLFPLCYVPNIHLRRNFFISFFCKIIT